MGSGLKMILRLIFLLEGTRRLWKVVVLTGEWWVF